MFYAYVLRSNIDSKFYTGYTTNLRLRLEKHLSGKVFSTKHRGDLKLIYFEGCINEFDAKAREKYLKSGRGKLFLKKRLKYWYKNLEAVAPNQ